MQYIVRYDVAPNQAAEFKQWLLDNDQALRDHQPDGWEYLGTWFTVMGFGRHHVESRFEVADYADLGSGFGDEELQKLQLEWFDFVEAGIPGETYLMKSATDVQVMAGT